MASKLFYPEKSLSEWKTCCLRWLVALMLVEMFPLGLFTVAKSGRCAENGCDFQGDTVSCLAMVLIVLIILLFIQDTMTGFVYLSMFTLFMVVPQLLEVLAIFSNITFLVFPFMLFNGFKISIFSVSVLYFYEPQENFGHVTSQIIVFLSFLYLHAYLLFLELVLCRKAGHQRRNDFELIA